MCAMHPKKMQAKSRVRPHWQSLPYLGSIIIRAQKGEGKLCTESPANTVIMKQIKFSKYESLGNDFVIIDESGSAKKSENKFPISLSFSQIKSLCNRHFGVGADGVIFLGRTSDVDCLVRMRIVNADGSVAKVCGNGLSCVISWLVNEGKISEGYAGKILTDAGPKGFSFENGAFLVDMGLAQVFPSTREELVLSSLEILGIKPAMVSEVNIGNPHLVLQLNATDELAAKMAPSLQKSTHFDGDANVGFVRVDDINEISLKVFERGVGLTLACGSGACAAVAALVAQGELEASRWIKVGLGGGTLHVMSRPRSADNGLSPQNMFMQGDANRVFSGSLEL